MTVTSVRIHLHNDGKLRGFAVVTIDDAWAIRNIRIIEGKDGLFVAMPCLKRPSGAHFDIVHPINAEAREELETKVLDEYERQMEGQ